MSFLSSHNPYLEWVKEQATRELTGFYAAIENIDDNVGKIIKALDEQG